MRKPYSKLTPAQRGAITRRARLEGKDPARVHAALKGAETRAANRYREAVRHGKAAREKTEKQVSTKTFRQRAAKATRLRKAGKRDGAGGRDLPIPRQRESETERDEAQRPLTLAALSRYRRRSDDYEIEIEGHHDTDGVTDIYAGK